MFCPCDSPRVRFKLVGMESKPKVTGSEPQPQRSDRPVDRPPDPAQPGHEPYTPPWADQPDQPAYSAYPPYPMYPTYPGYQGYAVYPYPPPPQPFPPHDNVRGQAIASLVCNILASLMCCLVFGVAGIVLSAIALNRSDYDLESARKLVRWSWGALAAAVVAGVAVVALVIAFRPVET